MYFITFIYIWICNITKLYLYNENIFFLQLTLKLIPYPNQIIEFYHNNNNNNNKGLVTPCCLGSGLYSTIFGTLLGCHYNLPG